MGQIKPVTAENYEFEYQQSNKKNGIFWRFQPVKFQMRVLKSRNVKSKNLRKWSNNFFDAGNEGGSLEEE